MIHEVDPPNREASAEVSYSETYRFRLWIAASQECRTLKMGFRAYHSYITRSLQAWRNRGFNLKNAVGSNLNIDELQPADVWGFFGKLYERPTSPGRRINDEKIAVLDVYFKIKYDSLAKTFGRVNIGFEFVTIMRTFFASSDVFIPLDNDELPRFNGIYAQRFDCSLKYIKAAMRAGRSDVFSLRLFVVKYNEEFDYIAVHNIILPIRPDFVPAGKDEAELRRYYFHHAPAATKIYSGIGFPLANSARSTFAMSCLLRDRATYDPYLTQIDILMDNIRHDPDWPISGEAEPSYIPTFGIEKLGDQPARSYLFIGGQKKKDKLIKYCKYTEPLANQAFSFFETLGADI